MALPLSLLLWTAVGAFWFAATRSFHPTRELAILVTSSLVTAMALASYANHLWLAPRYLHQGRPWAYALSLLAVMIGLTAAALAVIRTAYFLRLGPDPDPYGAIRHFLIDFFGVAAHIAAAAVVVGVYSRYIGGRR